MLIGRNEGARLPSALAAALRAQPARVVYVDSGSTDGSTEIARGVSSEIVVDVLDASLPFTAARGRNRGFELVEQFVPGLSHVQFVDGDCVLTDGYVAAALDFFRREPDVAIVVGHLREQHRERNAFHRLADMEWQGAVGDLRTTGGIFMMRADTFRRVGGFDGSVAAGEEFELASRVSALGLRIHRIDVEMARHDIDMQRFTDWWQRAVRAGHSLAEGLYIQSSRGKQAYVRELGSVLAYGALIPAAAATLALPTLGLSIGLLAAHARLWWKVRQRRLRMGDRPDDASLYANAVVLMKFAGAQGAVRFAARWARGGLAHGQHMLRGGQPPTTP